MKTKVKAFLLTLCAIAFILDLVFLVVWAISGDTVWHILSALLKIVFFVIALAGYAFLLFVKTGTLLEINEKEADLFSLEQDTSTPTEDAVTSVPLFTKGGSDQPDNPQDPELVWYSPERDELRVERASAGFIFEDEYGKFHSVFFWDVNKVSSFVSNYYLIGSLEPGVEL